MPCRLDCDYDQSQPSPSSRPNNILDETLARSQPIRRKPQQQILGTIWSTQSDHLVPLNAKIIHQPISNFLKIFVKLLVRPGPSLIFQESMIGNILLCPVLNVMIHHQLILGFFLSDVLLGFGCSIIETSFT